MTAEPILERRCPVRGCHDETAKHRLLADGERVCPSCADRGFRNLGMLVRRYVALRGSLVPGKVISEKIASVGFESTTPMRDAALNSMESIVGFAVGAEIVVRQSLGLVGPHRLTRPGPRLVLAVSCLTAQWDRIMPLEVGPRIAWETVQKRTHADLVLGWDRLVHRLPAPCPNCDLMSLRRDDGEDQVNCTACGCSWPESDYRRLVLILAEEVRGSSHRARRRSS